MSGPTLGESQTKAQKVEENRKELKRPRSNDGEEQWDVIRARLVLTKQILDGTVL